MLLVDLVVTVATLLGDCTSALCRGLRSSTGALLQLPAALDHLLHSAIVFALVLLEETSSLRVGGRVGVRVGQKRLNGGEDGRNVVNGAPLILKNIKANRAVGVNCSEISSLCTSGSIDYAYDVPLGWNILERNFT